MKITSVLARTDASLVDESEVMVIVQIAVESSGGQPLQSSAVTSQAHSSVNLFELI